MSISELHTHTAVLPCALDTPFLQEYATQTWLTTSLTCQPSISPRAYCCAIIHKTGMSGVRDYMSTCVYTDVSGGALGLRCNNQQHTSVNSKEMEWID